MGHHRNMSSHSLVSINSGDGGSPSRYGDSPQKHQRSSSSRTTTQQEVQKEFWPPLRALLKLGLAIVMIGWMTGTISLTNLPSKSVYVITSPLDYIPGMSSSIIRRKLISKKNRELLGKYMQISRSIYILSHFCALGIFFHFATQIVCLHTFSLLTTALPSIHVYTTVMNVMIPPIRGWANRIHRRGRRCG